MTQVEGPFPSEVETEPEIILGDYWTAKPEPRRWYFPDGKQYLLYEPMTYGKRTEYQTKTAQDINMERGGTNIKMRANMGSENHQLIVISTVGWNIYRDGKAQTFGKGTPGSPLEQFLAQFQRPELLDDYIKVLRDANPWLLGDVSSKDIQGQIDELQVRLTEALEREAGK